VNFSFTLGAASIGLTQNFDGVSPPALPAGWTQNQTTGTGITWTTVNTTPNSAPNAAFANDPAAVNATALESPAFPVSSAAAKVSFKNSYNTESTFDGIVLEIKIGAGAWTDIVTAGGSFSSGGYNATISTAFSSPIAGRQAWSGNAGGYINTVANLPASANGQNVQLRWLMASDVSVTATGSRIDDVQVINGYTCGTVVPPVRSRADFDGDGKTDLSVFRGSSGDWYLNRSTAGFSAYHFGATNDVPAPGDYDNDGKTDTAVFRPSTGQWFVLRSSDSVVGTFSWGSTGDVVVQGDYDGDSKTDAAVYRPSNNAWYILKSTGGFSISVYGIAGDIAVPGDYNGDGTTDFAVFRSGTWIIQMSGGGGGLTFANFGVASDKLVPADYDGDNKDDLAVFRPSTGVWYILRSSNGAVDIISWGSPGDVAVPGDYDGDGKDDTAIYRGGVWYLNRSTAGVAIGSFGLPADVPIPAKYIP
jgi:hypothetical protein